MCCRSALPQLPDEWKAKSSQALCLDYRIRRCFGSAYRRAQTRKEVSGSLTALQLRTGFTRAVILARAVQLGLSFSRRRPWTPEETELLQSLVGRYSTASIARNLRRTFASVKARVKQLEISVRITEGYSQVDLAELFGASPTSIRRWRRFGWLPLVNGRIPETNVVRFLRLHPHEYQLRRVDEAWFKGSYFRLSILWKLPHTQLTPPD